jgi:hypothetical protein
MHFRISNRTKRLGKVSAIGLFSFAIGVIMFTPTACAQERVNPAEPVVTTGLTGMPNGAIPLFTGKESDLQKYWTARDPSKPAPWPVANGVMTSSQTDIITKQKFTDFQLHLEFREPYMPNAQGQARGNSGVGLQGRYEIQILDSYGLASPGTGDCGAVYGEHAPLLIAYKPPRAWQTYDIMFRAPRFDASGKMIEKAHVTVLLNGVCIQNNQSINGATGLQLDENYDQPGPLLLQYHNNAVECRNIWILPLPLQGANHY